MLIVFLAKYWVNFDKKNEILLGPILFLNSPLKSIILANYAGSCLAPVRLKQENGHELEASLVISFEILFQNQKQPNTYTQKSFSSEVKTEHSYHVLCKIY